MWMLIFSSHLMLYTVIYYTKPKQTFEIYLRKWKKWLGLWSACVFLQSVLHLHQLIVVYINKQLYNPFWFLHIICGLNFWRLFSTVKKFKFRKCNCIQYTQKTTHCLEMRTFCKIIARYHAWNSSIFFVELSQTFIISISRRKKN